MTDRIKVEEVKSIGAQIEMLSQPLIRVVEDGASIGFLPPKMRLSAAKK